MALGCVLLDYSVAWGFSFDDPPGPQFTQEQIRQQRQAGAGLHDLIVEACQSGKPSVTIPPGDYRFGSDTVSKPKKIIPALNFEGLQRPADAPFTIVAQGVTFWFDLGDDEVPTCHFAIGFRHCRNLIIDGLTIDRGSRGCIEGRIIRIDGKNNRIEIEASAGTFIPTHFNGSGNQRLLPFKANGDFCTPFYALQHGSHLRYRNVVPASRANRYWVNLSDDELLKTNRDPQWIAAFGDAGTLRPGDGLHLIYTTTDAVSLIHCDSMVFRNFSNYIAKGDAVEAGGYGGHRWEGCYNGPRPHTNQWQGGDGVMVAATQHGSTYDHCTFISTTDDPINIHGRWGAIREISDHRVTFTASQAEGDATVGDTVLFYNKNTGQLQGEAKVTAIDGLTFSLDRDAAGFAGCVAEWPGHEAAGWVIKNCIFRDSYQRILAQTGPGSILDSIFTRLGQGIILGPAFFTDSPKYGFEGGVAHDIVIRGNTFTDVDMRPKASVIDWVPSSPDVGEATNQPPVARGLTISQNTFHLINPALVARSLGGITISGNTLDYPAEKNDTLSSLVPDDRRHAICLTSCRDVKVEANVLHDPAGFTRPNPTTGSRLLGIQDVGSILLDGAKINP